jgi:hypothetical protein
MYSRIGDGESGRNLNVFLLDKNTRIDVTSFLPLGTGGSSFAFKSRNKPEMILKLAFFEPFLVSLIREIIGVLPFVNRFKGEPIVMLTKTGTNLSIEQFFKLEVESQKQVNQLSSRSSPIVLTPDNKKIVQVFGARKFSGNLLDSGIFDFNGYSHQFKILLSQIGVDFEQLRGKSIGVIAMEDETEEFPLTISGNNNNNNVFKAAAFKAWFELCLNRIMHLDPNLKNFIFKQNGDGSVEARIIDFANIITLTGYNFIDRNPMEVFNELHGVFLKKIIEMYGNIDVLPELYGWLESTAQYMHEPPKKKQKKGGKSRNHKKRKSKTYKKKPK